jgi:hypothetical protein
MRWVTGVAGALVVLLLTFPVLASGSSDDPGTCTSAVGLQTLGTSESCDTWGMAFSLPAAGLVFGLVVWGWRRVRGRPPRG